MNDEDLRQLLVIGHEYSYLHDDWVHPLREALHGLTPEQALWRPTPNAKGIWDIVLHLAAWAENIVERVETGEKTRPKEGHWPPPPEKPTNEAWQHAQDRLHKAQVAMRKMIDETPIEKIEQSPYGTGDLLCRFIHNAYHIGQIVKMRECMPNPLP